MENKRCIAMAYDGRPLMRRIISATDKLVYLSTDSRISRNGDRAAVGFPHEYVFADDDTLFERLESAYRESDSESLERLWRQAAPLS